MSLTNQQYSPDYINAHRTDLKTDLVGVFETTPARKSTAEMKVFKAGVKIDTGKGLVGEHIVFGKLPKGITVLQVYWRGAGGTMEVGHYDLGEEPVDDQAFLPTLTAANVAGFVNYTMPDEGLIVGEISGQIAEGSDIELIVMYTEM